jgi:hypothetical protein
MELIADQGCQRVGSFSQANYLQYIHSRAAAHKGEKTGLITCAIIWCRVIYGLKAATNNYTTSAKESEKNAAARGSDTSFDP